jgi:hypothetical protein
VKTRCIPLIVRGGGGIICRRGRINEGQVRGLVETNLVQFLSTRTSTTKTPQDIPAPTGPYTERTSLFDVHGRLGGIVTELNKTVAWRSGTGGAPSRPRITNKRKVS